MTVSHQGHSKLTPRTVDLVVEGIAAGLPQREASIRAGISASALSHWLDAARVARDRDDLAPLAPCKRCAAEGTDPCLSVNGNVLRTLHAGRARPADEDRDPLLLDMLARCEKAEMEAHAAALLSIQQAGRGRPYVRTVTKSVVGSDGQEIVEVTETRGTDVHWQAAAWFLERRYPHLYSQRRIVEQVEAGAITDPPEHRAILDSIAQAAQAYADGFSDGQGK